MKELEKSFSAFAQLQTQIVLVSFGNSTGAVRWLNQAVSGTRLKMITDEKRMLYKLLGLKKSFHKVWCTQSLIYYTEQLTAKRELPASHKDDKDDPHQLGGNFIFEVEQSNFKMIYSYKSKLPNDRPSVQNMLKFLSER